MEKTDGNYCMILGNDEHRPLCILKGEREIERSETSVNYFPMVVDMESGYAISNVLTS